MGAGNLPAGACTLPWRQSWEPLPQQHLFVQDSEDSAHTSSLGDAHGFDIDMGDGAHFVGPMVGDPNTPHWSVSTRPLGTRFHLAGPMAPKTFPTDFVPDGPRHLGSDT